MFISNTKLKQIRKNEGWSQEVLAKASGLALRSIQRIESTGKASAESTLAICAALNIAPSELQSSKNAIEINWTRREIMQGFLIIGLIFGTILSLFFVASQPLNYLDGPSIIFTYCFMFLFTALSFGIKGVGQSISGLRFLFVQEFVGGKKAVYLAKIYGSQIKFCYGGSFILFFISVVAIIHVVAKSIEKDELLHMLTFQVPVVVMPFLYATITCEGLLRPLKIKLETSELSQ